MSLAIDTAKVHKVLLPDGKWHEVMGQSFEIDAYEYLSTSEAKNQERGTDRRLNRAQEKLLPDLGATWLERDGNTAFTMFCPLTAIQSVAYVARR
jgi:hypothetical protein